MSRKKPPVELQDPLDLETFVPEKESFRPQKVANRIREELLLIVPDGISDPRIRKLGGILAITEVTCPPDLRNARVLFSLSGLDELSEGEQGRKGKEAEKFMNEVAGYLRRELGDRLGLKYVPLLSFHFDRGLLAALKVRDLLKPQIRGRPWLTVFSSSADAGPHQRRSWAIEGRLAPGT